MDEETLRPIVSAIHIRSNGGLGQGGGSGGDKKWLDYGHTLKVGPKGFPSVLHMWCEKQSY